MNGNMKGGRGANGFGLRLKPSHGIAAKQMAMRTEKRRQWEASADPKSGFLLMRFRVSGSSIFSILSKFIFIFYFIELITEMVSLDYTEIINLVL